MQQRSRIRTKRTYGFTLVELMIAMTIGALLIAAVFTLSASTSRMFGEQQRTSQLQTSLRMAMEYVRRDFSLAGYFATPDSRTDPGRCFTPASELQAVYVSNDDTPGRTALNSMPAGSSNSTQADRVRLVGNYVTSDAYLVSGISNDGSRIYLQRNWQAFRRSFASSPNDTAITNGTYFAEVFRGASVGQPGRWVKVQTVSGQSIYTQIRSATLNAGGAYVDVVTPLPVSMACLGGMAEGALLSPITAIEYRIASAVPPAGYNVAVNGAYVGLVREEVEISRALASAGTGTTTARTILPHAVSFDVDLVLDNDATPQRSAPVLQVYDDALAQAQSSASPAGRPGRIRGSIVTLAARSAEIFPNLQWPYGTGNRPVADPLTRFRVFSDRDGTAIARSLTAEIAFQNLIAARR